MRASNFGGTLTNFSFEFFYKIFTEDASLPRLYYGAKKSKMTKKLKSGGGGGPALTIHGPPKFYSVARMVLLGFKVRHLGNCDRSYDEHEDVVANVF